MVLVVGDRDWGNKGMRRARDEGLVDWQLDCWTHDWSGPGSVNLSRPQQPSRPQASVDLPSFFIYSRSIDGRACCIHVTLCSVECRYRVCRVRRVCQGKHHSARALAGLDWTGRLHRNAVSHSVEL